MQEASTHSEIVAYFRTLMAAVNHHGDDWRPVLGSLAMSLFANSDPNTPFEYRTYKGNPAKQVKFTLKNQRVVKLTYNYNAGGKPHIVVYDVGRGEAVLTFYKHSTPAFVDEQITALAKARRRSLKVVAGGKLAAVA